MTVAITIEAQGPFSGDQRPVRSGVYMRIGGPYPGSPSWSYYNARTKLWAAYSCTAERAHAHRSVPSQHQRLPWYALPYDLPAGTRLEPIGGLVFRVIPPKS